MNKVIRTIFNMDFDKVVIHRNGTVSVYRYFFYEHGRTAQMMADRVKEVGEQAGLGIEIISARTVRKQWPADSCYVIRFSVKAQQS